MLDITKKDAVWKSYRIITYNISAMKRIIITEQFEETPMMSIDFFFEIFSYMQVIMKQKMIMQIIGLHTSSVQKEIKLK